MSVTDHRTADYANVAYMAWTAAQAGYDLPELADLIARPAWMAEGACRGRGVNFFPELGEQTAARVVCDGCPVREECLSYALEHRIDDGFWGGTSARERRRMRVVRSSGAPAA